jgi:Ca2+-dependent lipid-binding protein
MLEDAMQASLPKLVNGVRIADLGQGSEPMRIIAAKPIPTEDSSAGQPSPTKVEGDFVNLEVSVAYRARSTEGGGLKTRAQNAHLLVEFWTAADVRFPVWIELQGFIATLRVRLQLIPNPPFFAHGTVTFLGQPKVVVAAKPLSKSFINVMDVPGLAAWVQSNIDAAVSQYVAPRSLTLDLKTLLSGADAIDTDAVGVIALTIHSAIGFIDGDSGKFWASRDGKRGDLYVIVSWAKWGKPLWSTRIIRREAEPTWNENTAICVSHADLNAHERLRLTLWDSDRFTADDCLGTVEVPLSDIMHNEESRGKIQSRQDSLRLDKEEHGTLRWDVGYFNKVDMAEHLKDNPDANVEPTIQDLAGEAQNQLREAQHARSADDIKAQEHVVMKDASHQIISKTPPSDRWPSGILRIEIQQIHGLEVENVRGSGVDEMDDEGNDDLPSAYCTVIINHARVYKTRTKIKSNSPYVRVCMPR